MGFRNRNDAEGVYVWVCRLKGTTRGVSVFADRGAAKAWIEASLGEHGEWNKSEHKDRYDVEADTAIVERCPIVDAEALILIDPPEVSR